MFRFVGRLVVVGVVGMGVMLGYDSTAHAELLISGIIDGPRSGGFPKAVELYATTAIADLSAYSVVNFNNGGTAPSSTLILSGSASEGEYLYVASESPSFTAYFGFAPTFTGAALNVNGNDAVQLRLNDTPVDVFGVIGEDPAQGSSWNYVDSWFYRNSGTSATDSFQLADWFFAGSGSSASNALDSLGSSGVNPESGDLRMPIGSYAVPEPSLFAFAGLGLAVVGWRLRRRG